MTPYEIGVLLWYYAHADDHPDLQRNPPVWRPTIEEFKAMDLLGDANQTESDACYVLLPRGKAFVDSLQRVPVPVSTWRTEWPE